MPSATPWKLLLLGSYGTNGGTNGIFSIVSAHALPHPDRTPLDVMLGEILHIESPIRLDDPRNAPGPSGLMAGSDASARIAVEVLEEENIVTPVRVRLKLLRASIHRPPARAILHKRTDQPLAEHLPHLKQVH